MALFRKAEKLLKNFKRDHYLFGENALQYAGETIARAGKKAVLIRGTFQGSDAYIERIHDSAVQAGVDISAEFTGVRPNAPRKDLYRLADELGRIEFDCLVSFGGGSTIDAVKAAEVLCTLGGKIDDYFGTGLVSTRLEETDKQLKTHVAIQTVASSAAHLTKYSNITDLESGQKKLIVDDAIVPAFPIFDYIVNQSTSKTLTADGAFDGVSHCLEVLYGAVGKPNYASVEEIAVTGIGLIVNHLADAVQDRTDAKANRALCLATDLGGYAIMEGGTNGGHLTSFSLVDVLSHGRACAMMNPYYTVFFAPAIEKPLKAVGRVYQQAGFLSENIENLHGRALGMAVAEAMFALADSIGFPTRLDEVTGFEDAHIERALQAAKDPQLKMKLENMPVSLNSAMVDEYMGSVLQAARSGDLSLIKNVG